MLAYMVLVQGLVGSCEGLKLVDSSSGTSFFEFGIFYILLLHANMDHVGG